MKGKGEKESYIHLNAEFQRIARRDKKPSSAIKSHSTVATGLEKSVFIPIPKKSNAKECSNYYTIALTHASKVMFKILQARLQQYMN